MSGYARSLPHLGFDPAPGDAGLTRDLARKHHTVLEAVLAPFDIVAADHWVDVLEKAAGTPAEWVAELGKQIEEIQAAMRAGESPVDALIQAGKLAESTGGKIDAWYAFAPGWLKTAAGSLAEIKGLSYTLSGLGLIADAGTIISPQDQGAMGCAPVRPGGPGRAGARDRRGDAGGTAPGRKRRLS